MDTDELPVVLSWVAIARPGSPERACSLLEYLRMPGDELAGTVVRFIPRAEAIRLRAGALGA